jgi:hypothetical protein
VTYVAFAKALQWGDVLSDTVMVKAMLVELGFGAEVASMLRGSKMSSEEFDLLEICGLPAWQRSGERVGLAIAGSEEQREESTEGDSMIVVEKGAGSVAFGWRLSTQHAVLPVFAAQGWPGALGDKVVPGLNLGMLLLEGTDVPLRNTFSRDRVFRLAAQGSTTGGKRIIIAPASLDAAVEEAKKVLAALATSNPTP